jgi:hypothetical protein
VSPQDRQHGGSTPSTTARPICRNRLAVLAVKVADACIAAHHLAAGAFVNPQPARCGEGARA